MIFKKMIIGTCEICKKEGTSIIVRGVVGNTECMCKECSNR